MKYQELTTLNEKIWKLDTSTLRGVAGRIQPGYFTPETRILMIGTNPAMPNMMNSWDKKMYTSTISFLDFQLAYKEMFENYRNVRNFINSLGLNRSDVGYTNLVKIPTKENTPLTKEQVSFFLPYTFEQIRLVAPRLIITFGTDAANAILKRDVRLTQQNFYMFEKYSVFPLYHYNHYNKEKDTASLESAKKKISDFLEHSISNWF